MAAGQLLPVRYHIDGITFGAAKSDGIWWVPRKTTGWHTTTKPKTNRQAYPYGPGSSRSATWRGERVVSIQGSCLTDTTADRLVAEESLSAICSDPGALSTLTVTDQRGEIRTIDVELDDAPDVVVMDETRFDFSIQLAAPDPRKHDLAWQDPVSTPPTAAAGGLDWSAGLDFSGPGLVWGSAGGSPTVAQVVNFGSAPAHPLITLTGPLPPVLVQLSETGHWLRYAAEIGAGETVRINCDQFDARGVPPLACISTNRGNMGSVLSHGLDWPVVDPYTVASFTLRTPSGDPASSLMASLRSAWW